MAINRWNEVLTIKLKRKGVYTVIIILIIFMIGLLLAFIISLNKDEDFHTGDDTISKENTSSDTTTSSLLVSQSHDTGSHCDTGSSFDGGSSFGGGDCGGF